MRKKDKKCKNHHCSHKLGLISFIVLGISSFVWFILRSGQRPSRLNYPCQKIALGNSLTFFSWLGAIIASHFLFKKVKLFWQIPILGTMILLVFTGIKAYEIYEEQKLHRPIWSQTTKSRVVWVQNANAALGWTGKAFEEKADQTIITSMIDEGIKSLTNQTTVSAAWTAIFTNHNVDHHDYLPIEKIAIKINCNNYCTYDNDHNPLPQTIRALLNQLVNVKGVPQTQIYIYDNTRDMGPYIVDGIHSSFPQVHVNEPYGVSANCFNDPTLPEAPMAKLLQDTTYLINMPLLRTHSFGVTLSFKNHLGSSCNPSGFHNNITLATTANSLVRLNSLSYIKNKTILVLDDGIYGLKRAGPYGYPEDGSAGINPVSNPGTNYGGYPNSLFLSTDPVAIDSVMTDFLQSLPNNTVSTSARNYQQVAGSVGLGNYATSCSGNSCSFTYPNIDLVRCSPNCPTVNPTPTPIPVTGDLNNDQKVDIFDLRYFLVNFLQSLTIFDYSKMVENFGN